MKHRRIVEALIGRPVAAKAKGSKPQVSERTRKARAAGISIRGSGPGGGFGDVKQSGSIREAIANAWEDRNG